MLNYIFKVLLIFLLPISVYSQQGQAQKAIEKIGQVEKGNRFIPSAVRVGAEVANYFYSKIDDRRGTTWEFTADVDIHKYFLVVDYGYAAFNVNETYFDYSSKGSYFRIGPDINFIKKRKGNNVMFLGLRYARGNFDESVSYSTLNALEESSIWPESTLTQDYNGINVRWFELNTGLRANVFHNFYLGFTLRLKFAGATDVSKSFSTYYVPGYGKFGNSPNFGASYYVYYRLQFRDKYEDVFKKAGK